MMFHLVSFDQGLLPAMRGHPLLFSKQILLPGSTFTLEGLFGLQHVAGGNFLEPPFLYSESIFGAIHPKLLVARQLPMRTHSDEIHCTLSFRRRAATSEFQ